jgi:SfnB family sulfur acquisition oxidoreductase
MNPSATTATSAPSAPVIASSAEAITTAQAYAESLTDSVIERDRSGALPVSELARLDSSGLLAITIPGQDGGPDLSVETLTEVIRQIAIVDPAIAQAPQAHFLMVDVLAVWGSEAQRRALFGEVLAGGRIGNALAERGGAHAQDLKTRLRSTPDGLVLDGRKYYCTGAITSRWIAVSALDEQDRLVLAFVRRDADGVVLDVDWNVMGQRATVSGGAQFTGVEVDPELVVPYHEAFAVPQQLGARAQLVHAAIQVGIAGGALRDAGEFVRTRARPFFEAAREGWAESAGADPYTILRFGRLATKLRAAETLLADAAAVQQEIGRRPRDAEAAARGSVAVAQAKAFASEVAVEIASDLFSLSGASAADERHDLSRHWRNARTHASHDPADWKYHHAGNFLLNGALPPNHGQL